jgi:hypothetical protein
MGIFRASKRRKGVLLYTPRSGKFGYKVIGGFAGKDRRRATCGEASGFGVAD